jgi:hypothetical protein
MSAAHFSGGSHGSFSAPHVSSGSQGNFSAQHMGSGAHSAFSAPRVSSGSHGSFSAPRTSGGSAFTTSHNFNGSNHISTFNATHGNTFGNMNAFHGGNTTFKGVNPAHFNPAVNPGHFTAGTHTHPVNPQAWSHNGNWWHSGSNWWHGGGNWNHGHPWYGYNHFFPNFWYPFAWSGLWFPYWWSLGSSYGWGGYPYCEYYYGSGYGYQPTSYISTTDYVPSESYATNYQQAPLPNEAQTAQSEETDWGMQYLSGATDAFQQGSYADALRLANHAAIEMPQNAKPHELAALAAFALKDYRGANLEAHAALSLGQPADWRTLYGYYGDLPTYTKQLDALVDYLHEHKDAADARFVLAYHNLMMGHSEAAKAQFEKVLAKVPQDQLAAGLLKKLGGTSPAATPPVPTPPVPTVPAAEAVPPLPSVDKPQGEEPQSF